MFFIGFHTLVVRVTTNLVILVDLEMSGMEIRSEKLCLVLLGLVVWVLVFILEVVTMFGLSVTLLSN